MTRGYRFLFFLSHWHLDRGFEGGMEKIEEGWEEVRREEWKYWEGEGKNKRGRRGLGRK